MFSLSVTCDTCVGAYLRAEPIPIDFWTTKLPIRVAEIAPCNSSKIAEKFTLNFLSQFLS